jgi:hypothetical protein
MDGIVLTELFVELIGIALIVLRFCETVDVVGTVVGTVLVVVERVGALALGPPRLGTVVVVCGGVVVIVVVVLAFFPLENPKLTGGLENPRRRFGEG